MDIDYYFHVEYDPENGLVVPDNKAYEIATKIIEERKNTTVGSFLIIDFIRLLIKREYINHKEICFRYNNKDIFVCEEGFF